MAEPALQNRIPEHSGTEMVPVGVIVHSLHNGDHNIAPPKPAPNTVIKEERGGVTSDAGYRNEANLSREEVRRKVNGLRLKSSTIEQLSRDETELRIKMYFHISNPVNRWRKFHYVTWKFFLQLAKTFCVVAQVCLH